MRLRAFIVVMVALALALAFVPGAWAAERVTLRLNWKVYGEHAPFFLGVEKGFYKAEGIDLKIGESTKGSGHTVSLIANKNDMFGYADTVSVIKGIGQGMELISLAVFHQMSPMGIISMADKRPIRTKEDLEGARIAVVQGDSLYNVWPAVVARNNIKTAKLVYVATGPAKAQYTLAGKTDALLGYVSTQPVIMEKASGRKTITLRFADLGVNNLSQGLFVRRDFLAQNKDLCARMVRASVKAWDYANKHPEEAVRALVKLAPGKHDFDLTLEQFRRTQQMIWTENSKGHPPGWMSIKDWDATLDIQVKYGGLKKRLPTEQYFTNEFIQ